MLKDALISLIPLTCYVVFVFYAFCDGFNLRPARKVVWAVYFLSFCYLSFLTTLSFDLEIIIPLSSIVAFALAWFQKRDNRINQKQ